VVEGVVEEIVVNPRKKASCAAESDGITGLAVGVAPCCGALFQLSRKSKLPRSKLAELAIGGSAWAGATTGG